MKSTPYSELKKGTFLIASPAIEEGIFYRSVVLLCDHNSIGSFGLIVNKPLEIPLDEDLLGFENMDTQVPMRVGGPNEPHQVMLIQDRSCDKKSSLEICKGVYLNGDVESIQEGNSILYFGYGGWESGVLEKEFLNKLWFLCPATKDHIFNTPTNQLWQILLREMGGKYKTLSIIPENPELN